MQIYINPYSVNLTHFHFFKDSQYITCYKNDKVMGFWRRFLSFRSLGSLFTISNRISEIFLRNDRQNFGIYQCWSLYSVLFVLYWYRKISKHWQKFLKPKKKRKKYSSMKPSNVSFGSELRLLFFFFFHESFIHGKHSSNSINNK